MSQLLQEGPGHPRLLLLCGAACAQEEGLVNKISSSTGLRNRSENLSLSGARLCGKTLCRAPCPPVMELVRAAGGQPRLMLVALLWMVKV